MDYSVRAFSGARALRRSQTMIIGDVSSSDAVTRRVAWNTSDYALVECIAHTLSGCQAISLIPRLPPTAKLPPVLICPASVPAPPPYASATTSLFPLRSQTTVYPVLLAPARTYCTCWFQAIDVISSNFVLRVPGVGV